MENIRYTGTIVQESLIDERVMNSYEIKKYAITEEDDPTARWHLFTVNVTRPQIEALAKNLKSEKWYAHFWNGDHVIAVFPNRIFEFHYSDKSTWIDAVEYGKTIGIPESQLTFVIEN